MLTPKEDVFLIIGDWNAKVGKGRGEGKYRSRGLKDTEQYA